MLRFAYFSRISTKITHKIVFAFIGICNYNEI